MSNKEKILDLFSQLKKEFEILIGENDHRKNNK